MELRRLEWKRGVASKKEIEACARALDWERKSLAQALKWEYEDEEREELYEAWRIPLGSKERKLQLVLKLWSREVRGRDGGYAVWSVLS